MNVEDLIEELVSVILIQEKELDELREKVRQINQYIKIYESYIKGE